MSNQTTTPPHQQHTLLALCGMSPAVITETIWALAMEGQDDPSEADLPDRVIILTTQAGRDAIRHSLIEPESPELPAVWSQLKSSLAKRGYDVEGKLQLGDTSEHIRCFASECNVSGLSRPLEDIRSLHDQNAAADYMLETLAHFTDHTGERLTVSIAGGRKTMSALLYGCMSLAGRREDRLTHVLVSAPYDSPSLIPNFFFPEQHDQHLLLDKDVGDYVEDKIEELPGHLASQAIIELADIPFVPLRYAFPDQLSQRPISFQRLSALYTGAVLERSNLPELALQNQNGKLVLTIGSHLIELRPAHAGIFHFLFTRAHDEAPAFPDYKSAIDPIIDHLEQLRKQAPKSNLMHWQHKIESAQLDDDNFRRRLSNLRKKFQTACPFGPELAKRLPAKGRVSLDYPAEKLIL